LRSQLSSDESLSWRVVVTMALERGIAIAAFAVGVAIVALALFA